MIDTSEVFACALADFGETVTVAGQSITALYNEPFAVAAPLDYGVETTDPRLIVKTADLPGATDHGTAVTVRGRDYIVSGIETNNQGETVLTLRSA